jgi:hypothetical protein
MKIDRYRSRMAISERSKGKDCCEYGKMSKEKEKRN